METVRMDVPLDQIKKVLLQLPPNEKIALWHLWMKTLTVLPFHGDLPLLSCPFAKPILWSAKRK